MGLNSVTMLLSLVLVLLVSFSSQGPVYARAAQSDDLGKVVADDEIDTLVARAHITSDTASGDTKNTDISIEVQEKQHEEVNPAGGNVEVEAAAQTNAKSSNAQHAQQTAPKVEEKDDTDISNFLFLVIVICCSALGVIGLIIAGYCWYKLHQSAKAAGEADYPAYGVTGPSTKSSAISNGDRKLAQSAQMYHYQHQKQQMIAMESRSNGEAKQDASDDDSEEENEEGDYTVYECPGLAPAGEMTVKNPLFSDDQDQDPQSPVAKDEK
ncbi:neural proliferation differentiation and control protein 1-like isoform X2 [Ptychodera flava]|uniref:neural proliferation differentiation and control protein 1-like isoform X2 n=1 Tax=Ptychodera flava TaxID=63121 RepID=UPI003969F3A8